MDGFIGYDFLKKEKSAGSKTRHSENREPPNNL